jgi:response regulator NasT
MDRVLVVSGSVQGFTGICEFLKKCGYQNVTHIQNGSEAKQRVSVEDYDITIINAPLKDEFGSELAVNIAQRTISGVILLCKADMADEIADRVFDYGVCVVAKPLNKYMFQQAIRMSMATHSRMTGLKKENQKLQTKINEMRYLNQAKYLLINNLGYSEDEAHKYIEQTAMDTRRTKLEVSKNIIEQYE